MFLRPRTSAQIISEATKGMSGILAAAMGTTPTEPEQLRAARQGARILASWGGYQWNEESGFASGSTDWERLGPDQLYEQYRERWVMSGELADLYLMLDYVLPE